MCSSPAVSYERRREAAPIDVRQRGVQLSGAAAMAMAKALLLVIGDGAHVGAGLRRPAPTTPSVVTVDNPITGARVPDAVYHGTSAPNAVVIGTRAGRAVSSGTVTAISAPGIVLSI